MAIFTMMDSTNIFCMECPIRRLSPFHAIPEREMERVHDCKITRTYQKGEIVYRNSEPSDFYYAIMEGSVQVYRQGGGREQSFAIAGPGSWIGYRDCLAQIPYQNSARALSRSLVCRINKDVLHDLIGKYPAFTAAIMNDMAMGWVESEHQSYNLGARKTIERLADFLLGLKNDISARVVEDPDTGNSVVEVEFPLTRETVATLIGTTTESVIRSLSDFKARGWIEFQGSRMRLTNEEALYKLVRES